MGLAEESDRSGRVVSLLRESGLPEGELLQRCSEEAQKLLHEHGVTFNTYEDDPGKLRSWQLDSIPYVIEPDEWQSLEAGVLQRARLAEALIEDLYGRRRMLLEGLLPAELIFTHPCYLLPAAKPSDQQSRCEQRRRASDQGTALELQSVTVGVAARPMVIFGAIDIVRSDSGEWLALDSWSQSPAGAGYALENRITLARAMPELYRNAPLRRLAGFLQAEHRCLAALAASKRDEPNIVLLTPGPGSPGFFEHAWLANYMNFTLAEGADLVVRDGQVAMRTLAGLKKVDVILRHIHDPWCDPLELRADSLLGVPGLMQAARNGDVEIANSLGSGVLEHPGLQSYLPQLCERLLGEKLLLRSPEQLWCGLTEMREELLDSLHQGDRSWLVRDIRRLSEVHDLRNLGEFGRTALLQSIEREPDAFVARRPIRAEPAPTYDSATRQINLAPTNLRLFTLVEPDDLEAPTLERRYRVMPGGLAWIGEPGTPQLESRTVKDIWVLAEIPQPHITLLRQAHGPIVATRDGGDLPCRVADSLFWMGRYGERIEIRARLLRLALVSNEALMPDLFTALDHHAYPGDPAEPEKSDFAECQRALMQLLSDYEPNGLQSHFSLFLRNSRAVRDHIGDDSWRIVNKLRQAFNEIDEKVHVTAAQRQLENVVTDLAALFGLTNETMPHHYGWLFLDIGRYLDRLLHSIRLLQLALLAARQPGIPLWEVVLATTDNLTVYRRRYRSQLHPTAILDLLLFDETNPRSVGYMLERLNHQIELLPRQDDSPYRNLETRLIIEARSRLHLVDISLIAGIDHDHNARVALSQLFGELFTPLSQLSEAITHRHFSHVETPRQLVTMQKM